ncbi:MAG TPA: hypothetical protein VF484_07760 [Candidatus Limnocylindrales bacterium]
MIVYGWLGRPTVLAEKQDLCATCGVMGPHAIVRIVRWATVFWAPILPIWISHKLICGNCGAQTKLSWGQTRAALRTGRLPMPHREGFDAHAAKVYDETYRRPVESELDPITRNPKRDAWNVYLKAWPIIVGVLIAAVVFWPRASNPTPAGAPGASPSHVVIAHTCWVDPSSGTITGCRLVDGTVQGFTTGQQTTCYFLEPMPTGDATFKCDS